MFAQVFLLLMCARIILADSVKSLYCVFVAACLPTATLAALFACAAHSRQDRRSENQKTAAEQEDVDTATTSNYTITQA